MTVTIPEKNKKPGVCYAVADDELELPVIDVTHPSFVLNLSDADLSDIIDQSLQSMKVTPEALKAAAQSSLLIRLLIGTADTVTSGMTTYLFKLGPDQLGDGYATPVDRKIATGISLLSFRLRLQNVARLIADGLAPALQARAGQPVHLLNIAGGSAIDSLNGLILLRSEHPHWLADREIVIHVLDPDTAGPNFGARALAALQAEGAPLNGLKISFERVAYDWTNAGALAQIVGDLHAPDAVMGGSSEGGLFQYGSDAEVMSNLQVLRDCTPDDFLMVGTLVQDEQTLDRRLKALPNMTGRPSIRFMGMDTFNGLVERTGWTIDRVINDPVQHSVSLRKA